MGYFSLVLNLDLLVAHLGSHQVLLVVGHVENLKLVRVWETLIAPNAANRLKTAK